MFGLAPFHFRNGVSHHTCSSLHIQRVVFHDAGADSNRDIHITRKTQVATRAAVQATLGGLQLVDQLHRMHLRRTRQGAGRKRRFEHIHAGERFAVSSFTQDAFDIAHDMHHMAVALDHKGFGHFDTTNLRDTPNVVARQVDQHHVFSALFRVVDEFKFCRFVCLWCDATWTRSSQWADGDFLALGRVFLTYQNFRRGSHHMGIAQVVVIHIGTGVERTQSAVQR